MSTVMDERTPFLQNFPDDEGSRISYNALRHNQDTSVTASSGNDEEASICSSFPRANQQSIQGAASIIGVLVFGEFLSNADVTLVLAATGRITSEFNSLQNASWVSTAYTLGVCTTLPMYTKLSDVFGRKPLLLAAYFFLAFGCIVCGTGPQMWVFIVGRTISGIGGAGIMAMGSVIILDIVPTRDVAFWRACVNIAMTLGRSTGGPLGGWLADLVGWRWPLIFQAPLIGLVALLVLRKLHLTPPVSVTGEKPSLLSRLKRIDFLGAILMTIAIIVIVFIIDQGGKSFGWASWASALLVCAFFTLMSGFCYMELCIAKEPIFDLRILGRLNVLSSYAVGGLQSAAQAGMIFCVPLYFQVTARASTAEAGGHLIPAVLGNTVGALVVGLYAKKFGLHKSLLVVACTASLATYLLLLVRWNGNTNFLESLYIIPAGLGAGMTSTIVFATMNLFLDPGEMATVTGGFILTQTFIMSVGVTGTNTLLGSVFRKNLQLHIQDPEIIQRATSNIDYIFHLSGNLRDIIVHSYINALKHTYVVCAVLSILALLLSFIIRVNHA